MTVTYANLTITATRANLERLERAILHLETVYLPGPGHDEQYTQFQNLQGLMFRVDNALNGRVL